MVLMVVEAWRRLPGGRAERATTLASECLEGVLPSGWYRSVESTFSGKFLQTRPMM